VRTAHYHTQTIYLLRLHLCSCIIVLHFLQAVSYADTKKPIDQGITVALSKLSPKLITLNQEVRSALLPTSSMFIWSTEDKSVVLEESSVFYFIPQSDGVYSLQYQSDVRILFMDSIDGNSKIVSMPTTFSQVPRINKFPLSLKKNQKLWIVLGTNKVFDPIIFRIGIFDSDNQLRADRNREYSSVTIGDNDYDSVVSIDKDSIPIKYFRPIRNNTDTWISIFAQSERARPHIIAQDASDNEVVHDLVRADNLTSSQVVIGPHTSWSAFAIQQFQDDNSKKSRINLSISEYQYNPNDKIFGPTSYYLSNALIAFCLGGILTFLISYLFYRKTFSARLIYVGTEQDRAVVDTDKTRLALLFGPNKEPIHCASLCAVRIFRRGYGHVTRSDVLKTLSLKLQNVVRIVTFQYEKSDGWSEPKLSGHSANTMELEFDNLGVSDYIKITALCEQDGLKEIIPVLEGTVKDAIIRSLMLSPKSYSNLIRRLIYGWIFSAPAIAMAIYLTERAASWYGSTNYWVWIGTYAVLSGTLLCITLLAWQLWPRFLDRLRNFWSRAR
jgi:hypothetical protein